MVQIVPAILATSEDEFRTKLSSIDDSPSFKDGWVQIDLMDSRFVQNQSINPEIIGKCKIESLKRESSLKIEAHLMVEYPENWIDELIKVGVERIVFPVEDTEGVMERVGHIKNHGIEVGLSINPQTQLQELEDYLEFLDVVLVMSVNPGFQGQEFIPESIEKIKECSRLRSKNDLNFMIGVDGGVSEHNVKDLVTAGVDYLVIGSALFEYDILEEGLEKIWEAIHG